MLKNKATIETSSKIAIKKKVSLAALGMKTLVVAVMFTGILLDAIYVLMANMNATKQ